MDTKFDSEEEIKVPRPTIITVFVILTLVGTSLVLISNILAGTIQLGNQVNEIPLWMTIIVILVSLGKLGAAVLLLQMRRLGFFLYAGCEVVVAVTQIFSTKLTLDILEETGQYSDSPIDLKLVLIFWMGFSITLTILFISVYASQLSKMK